ncbi:hypothetical protein C0993_012217, partial [Termitomyces sp. T159_Od127]
MSAPLSACFTANPDVSGIGVRIAIYAQNLLSFIPAFWALKDRRITPTELDELEKQSTTILITAFAILISTVIQAHDHGISDYHASIVLDLSWMNNTNLFIYFLLYIYHRVNLSDEEFKKEVRVSARRATLKLRNQWSVTWWIYLTKEVLREVGIFNKGFSQHALPEYKTMGISRWVYETKKALTNFVIIIGSFHLSLMAAVGLLTLAIFDVVLLVDTEVAIKRNTNQFQLNIALRDLIESISEKHAKRLDEQLSEALVKGEQNAVAYFARQGARSNIQ